MDMSPTLDVASCSCLSHPSHGVATWGWPWVTPHPRGAYTSVVTCGSGTWVPGAPGVAVWLDLWGPCWGGASGCLLGLCMGHPTFGVTVIQAINMFGLSLLGGIW